MKPAKLTKMVEGKSLGAEVHRGLGETFNWLVDFCDHLQGDGKYIEVQNPSGDWPMITFGDEPPGGSGETSGGLDYKDNPLKPFDLQFDSEGNGHIVHNYFYFNRTLQKIDDYDLSGTGTYYLKITHSTTSLGWTIEKDSTVDITTTGLSNTDDVTYYKLWTISDTFIFDWRSILTVPFYEY